MTIDLNHRKNSSIYFDLGHMLYVNVLRDLPSRIEELQTLHTAEEVYSFFQHYHEYFQEYTKMLHDMYRLAGTTYRDVLGNILGNLQYGYLDVTEELIKRDKNPRSCTRPAARELRKLADNLSAVLVSLMSIRNRAQQVVCRIVLDEIESLDSNDSLIPSLQRFRQSMA